MAKKNNPKAEKAKRNLEYARLHKKKPRTFGRSGGRFGGPRPGGPGAGPGTGEGRPAGEGRPIEGGAPRPVEEAPAT